MAKKRKKSPKQDSIATSNPNASEQWNASRDLMDQYLGALNQRFNWLTATEGFVLTAFAIVVNAATLATSELMANFAWTAVAAICIVGAIVPWLFFRQIEAYAERLQNVRKFWSDLGHEGYPSVEPLNFSKAKLKLDVLPIVSTIAWTVAFGFAMIALFMQTMNEDKITEVQSIPIPATETESSTEHQPIDGRVLAALVSGVAILVSTTISSLLAWFVSRREIKKLALERETVLLDRLYQKRLDNYPRLFSAVSRFLKKVRFGTTNLNELTEFRDEFERLDSELTIYFSPGTSKALHEVNRLLQNDSPKQVFEDLSDKQRKQIEKVCKRIETSLQQDLGVYTIKEFEPLPKYKSKVDGDLST